MAYDGLIWKPPWCVEFAADPFSMGEILWSVRKYWYIISIYDPDNKEDFDSSMEYFVDAGLFEKPFVPRYEVIIKMSIMPSSPHRSRYCMIKPLDLKSFIFMIAFSDFDGLQIRSIEKHVNDYYDASILWRNTEEIIFDNASMLTWPSRLKELKSISKINILWGFPNWDFGRNSLIISEDEQLLIKIKEAINKYKSDNGQDNDDQFNHQAILCNAQEEILKYSRKYPKNTPVFKREIGWCLPAE